MSGIVITFPGRRSSTANAASNPSFDLPRENVAEVEFMTPGDARRLRKLQSEPETETGKNAQLRLQRRDAWWNAERQVDYWKAVMRMHHAISAVQSADLPEGGSHQKAEHWHWHPIVDNYRKALVRLLLTPAHRRSDITWKQKVLASEEHKHTNLTTEYLEATIAKDIEFLAAHPTRRNTAPASG
jgi:hypothetical protein